jgi:hypothetical protein
MISGNEQATEQFYVKRIGADDFMKKPFSRHEVFGRMDSLVEIRKLASIGQNEIATNLPEIPATPDPAAAAAASSIPCRKYSRDGCYPGVRRNCSTTNGNTASTSGHPPADGTVCPCSTKPRRSPPGHKHTCNDRI